MKKHLSSHHTGFTLIELLVAMIIIGILSTIALGNFQTTQMKARDARRKADLKHIVNALEAYINDHNQYPPSVDGQIQACVDELDSICVWDNQSQLKDEAGTIYMVKLPSDPKAYSYFYLTVKDEDENIIGYQLYARLENTLDQAVPKDADDNPQVYRNTTCSTADPNECNYGISSTNTLPETGHTLINE